MQFISILSGYLLGDIMPTQRRDPTSLAESSHPQLLYVWEGVPVEAALWAGRWSDWPLVSSRGQKDKVWDFLSTNIMKNLIWHQIKTRKRRDSCISLASLGWKWQKLSPTELGLTENWKIQDHNKGRGPGKTWNWSLTYWLYLIYGSIFPGRGFVFFHGLPAFMCRRPQLGKLSGSASKSCFPRKTCTIISWFPFGKPQGKILFGLVWVSVHTQTHKLEQGWVRRDGPLKVTSNRWNLCNYKHTVILS